MSEYGYNKKKDGKQTKIHVALKNALFDKLTRHRFSKISVHELCEKALVSRSTFYVYFDDKFDLLKYCMQDIKNIFELYVKDHNEMEIITAMHRFIFDHSKQLKHVLFDQNMEVISMFVDLMTQGFFHALSEKKELTLSLAEKVLANFCAGGYVNLIMWQLKNNFPVDEKHMTIYLYNMLHKIEDLDLELE